MGRVIPTFQSCGVFRESRSRGLPKIVLDIHLVISADSAAARKQHTYYGHLVDAPERGKGSAAMPTRRSTCRRAERDGLLHHSPVACFAGTYVVLRDKAVLIGDRLGKLASENADP